MKNGLSTDQAKLDKVMIGDRDQVVLTEREFAKSQNEPSVINK